MTPEEQAELIELRKIKEEYISLFPRLEFFQENKGYWATLFFIPQDLGFEHMVLKKKGHPNMDVFHRDGISMTKAESGDWIIQRAEERMFFKINNKFEAYIILRSLGLDFDNLNANEKEMPTLD